MNESSKVKIWTVCTFYPCVRSQKCCQLQLAVKFCRRPTNHRPLTINCRQFVFSGNGAGTTSEVVTSPLPSRVPECGQSGYITSAVWKVPNDKRRGNIRSGSITPATWGGPYQICFGSPSGVTYQKSSSVLASEASSSRARPVVHAFYKSRQSPPPPASQRARGSASLTVAHDHSPHALHWAQTPIARSHMHVPFPNSHINLRGGASQGWASPTGTTAHFQAKLNTFRGHTGGVDGTSGRLTFRNTAVHQAARGMTMFLAP